MPTPLDWIDDALADLDRRGLRRTRIERQARQRNGQIEIDGQWLVNFGSNDYLGLAAEPRVIAAIHEALDAEGWGAAASPLVTGRSSLHAQLERELAAFQGTEAALLFPTGYAANVGAITALVGNGDFVYSDALNHASIIDGCRLSGATVRVYPNTFFDRSRGADFSRLREMLAHDRGSGRKLIVTDAVFSMHGTFAYLGMLVPIAQEFGAMLMVDEAHAIGVIGDRGSGLCEAAECGAQVDLRIGTLSKALGGHGGFVAASQQLIDWLANRARSYVFSTAAPPAVAAAGLASLEIVKHQPERRRQLNKLAIDLRHLLIERGLIQPTALTHIAPVVFGDPDRAVAAAADLRRRGFFVPAIRPPSVPQGQSLLRISLTWLHTQEQINDLVAALVEVAK